MVHAESERAPGQGGFGHAIAGSPELRSGQGLAVSQGQLSGITGSLHCTGCSENVPEGDVFDITGYRTDEHGRDEVSFICPFCGSASISLRSFGV